MWQAGRLFEWAARSAAGWLYDQSEFHLFQIFCTFLKGAEGVVFG